MKPIKNLFILFSFLMVLGLVESCQKGEQMDRFIGEENKAQNPFNGGEELTYVTDEGEQIIMIANERVNEVHKENWSNYGDYFMIELDFMHFNSEGGNQFTINMNGRPRPKVDFSIYNNNQIIFGYGTDLPLSKDNTSFVDSLLVMGNWEKDVFYFEKEQEENKAYKMYYSTKNGIVHIDFSDGGFWELESIEW